MSYPTDLEHGLFEFWDAVKEQEGENYAPNVPAGYPYVETPRIENRTILNREYLFFNDSNMATNEGETLGLIPGETYTIKWLNTTYSCVCYESEFMGMKAVVVGNSGFMGGENTGEPFIGGDFPDQNMWGFAVPSDPGMGIPVTITGNVLYTEYHTIKEEYLPSAYYYDSDLVCFPIGDCRKIAYLLSKGCSVFHTTGYKILHMVVTSNVHYHMWILRDNTLTYVSGNHLNDERIESSLGRTFIELFSSSGKKFSVTVDDSGTLKATEIK